MKPNWGESASGAVQGGVQGAAAGGPVGGVVGAVTGFAKGVFSKKKKKKKPKKVSTLDEKQQKLNDEQYAALKGEGPLADLYNYDPEAANKVFDENIARYAYRDLKEKGIPGVTGQFRSNGLMQSSYAGDAISKLVRDVQESLDAKRSDYLYNEQKAARKSKQDAVENLQNRQTFAYQQPQAGGGGGSNIPGMDWVNSISSSDVKGASDWIEDAIVKYAPGGVN
jgi:hypothetical protein